MEEFVADGTAVSAGFLVERVLRGGPVLLKPIVDIKFVYDIGVDMFGFAWATRSRDISGVMGVLPRGSVLYADCEFFSRGNCAAAFRRGIDFQVKPPRVFSGRILRRTAERFSAERYRRRKNGERGAAVFDRVWEIPYRDPESVISFVVFRAAAHNVRRMLKLEALAGLFVRINCGGGCDVRS
ncbi:MAG: hypothetical protein ACTSXX_02215 [Candidatus Baldrarchaeia archaeon]